MQDGVVSEGVRTAPKDTEGRISALQLKMGLFFQRGKLPQDDLGCAKEADAGGAGAFHADAAGDV